MEKYTADDVTAQTITEGGSIATAGANGVGRIANLPIGIVPADVFQDIRGKWGNYDVFSGINGILCDYYIETPYVVDASGYLFDDGDKSAYNAVMKKYQFMWALNKLDIRPGILVQSDRFGKFVPQYPGKIEAGNRNTRYQHLYGFYTPATEDGAPLRPIPSGIAAHQGYKTVQTVGRVVSLDNRNPKDMLQYVDTYPESQMPGTDTQGQPSHLFFFLYDYLTTRNGSAPTAAQIESWVHTTKAGLVRLQLEIGG
jgi:hypothetical protein